jgi:DNA-binding Xre family transcriptional regulator
MAVDERHVAENVRRLAGAADVPLVELASWVGLSRAGLMKIVDRRHPSKPRTETLLKLATAFDVTPNDLLSEPPTALLAAVEAWIAHGEPPVKQENVEPISRAKERK